MKKSNEASNDKNEIQNQFLAGPSESFVAFLRDGISHNGNSGMLIFYQKKENLKFISKKTV